MSKKNESTQAQQPEFLGELLLNGSVTLKAKSIDALNEMVNEIPADCSYGAGAVGRNRETGEYSLRIDLTTTKE